MHSACRVYPAGFFTAAACLAELVGVHKNIVYAWEAGNFTPRGENLLKIADALDCDAKELIQK